jgi:hypothetical protein
MARYRERLSGDWRATTLQFALLAAMVVFALVVIEPRRGTFWAVAFVVAGAWTMTALFHRRNAYRCSHCKRVFQVPTAVNFVTPSAVGKNRDGTYYSYKKLTCPLCGHKGQARVVTRGDMTRGGGQLLGERRARRR